MRGRATNLHIAPAPPVTAKNLIAIQIKNKEVTNVQSLPLLSDFVIVGYRDELSNFIRDFRKIVEFIKNHPWLGV